MRVSFWCVEFRVEVAVKMWPDMIPAFVLVGSAMWLTGFLLRKMDEFEFDGKVREVLNFSLNLGYG